MAMRTFDYPILAPEGRGHLLLALAGGGLATWLWGAWSWPVWVLVALVAQFFRDPKRRISDAPGAVVSPASGKIVQIGEADNPYIANTRALRVSIFMNVFSVHSNLIPISGTVMGCEYFRGKFVNAALDKASAQNERNAVWVKTAAGQDVVCVQIAGFIARRILCYVKKGDTVTTGQRYGFIRFGSRVDVYLPLDTKLGVKLGQWVASGNDVLGRIG